MESLNWEHIIVKVLSGKATEQEILQFENWKKSSSDHEALYKDYLKIWDKSAQFKLDSIDVEKALRQTKYAIPEFRSKQLRRSGRFRIAATLISVLLVTNLLTFFLTHLTKRLPADFAMTREIQTTYGTQSNFTLEDGTKIWLNSGSKLVFPVSFQGKKCREVKLLGEAYFEVAKDHKHPFIVNTKQLNVRVWGTKFDVQAYGGILPLRVALVEGKVSLEKPETSGTKQLTYLSPGDLAEYKQGKFFHVQSKNSLYSYVAWKEGRIVFDNTPVTEVAEILEHWFNVPVLLGDQKIGTNHITGSFKQTSLDQILKSISYSMPIRYVFKNIKQNKGITTTNKLSQEQEVILYSEK